MNPIRKVAILLHQRDRRAHEVGYIAWLLAKEWTAQGMEIEILRGIDRVVEADLLFPQIDLSVIPDEYRRTTSTTPVSSIAASATFASPVSAPTGSCPATAGEDRSS